MQELKRKRYQFLFHLYESTGGHRQTIINMWDLGKEFGFSKDEIQQIVEYLNGEGLIKHVTFGGGISITHTGVIKAESSHSTLETSMMKSQLQTELSQKHEVNDKEARASHQMAPVKILFLSANPKNTEPLRLDEEMRAIDQALRQSEFRDRFDIRQHWAVRVNDIQSYFLRHKPDIVHFSGHGSKASEIILENSSGYSKPVSPRALGQLFSVLKDNIRCVVLNACHSEKQAKAIAEHIDCVIGMSKSIGDSSAIGFATAFYQALGYGRNVKTAFDLGCLQIDLENLAEQNIPKLLSPISDPNQIVFVQDE